jgi:DNA polymerase-3 subunit alpha
MMFATLDDLSGAVEVLVFGKALAEHEAALVVDQVVLIKGRVDHKEADKTCVIAQSVEPFSPGEEELAQAQARDAQRRSPTSALARPLHLRIDAASLADGAIDELKQAIEECPGASEVLLDIATSSGTRRLKFGDAYRVAHTAALRAELEHALAPFASAAAG